MEVHCTASVKSEKGVMEKGQKVSAIYGKSRKHKLEAQECGQVLGLEQYSVVATRVQLEVESKVGK